MPAAVLKAAGLLLLALAFSALPAWAQSQSAAPKQQLEEVQKQLQESRERQRELDKEARDLQQKSRSLQSRLVTSARKLQAQEDAVSRSEEQLDKLKADETRAAAALDARREELAATLASLARLTRQPPEAMALAPGSALDTVRASQLIAALVPELESRGAALRAELERLASLRQGVAKQQTALGRAIADLDRERRELELLQAETTAAAEQTREERDNERDRAQKLAEQAKDLRSLVDRLLEQERRDAEQRAARNRRQPPENYAALEGSAALPARGRIIGRFGDVDSAGVNLRGIRIETRAGGQVVAPADGKVMFAGPFRGYGQLLIIAHGGGYHSLLAGFARIDRAVGQFVLAGEPVGAMAGSSSATTAANAGAAGTNDPDNAGRPVLYLELRRKGEPVNPLPWLAAGDRKASG